MTSKQPPGIATWMLKQFGSGSNNETLLGDLAEQYQHNGSAMWYWRQAMKAIPVSFFREIRAYKRISIGALLRGWAVWIVGGSMILPLVFPSGPGPQVGFHFVLDDPLSIAAGVMWMPTLGLHYLNREGLWSTPSSFILAIALPLIVGIICGWLVARWQISVERNPFTIRIPRVHPDRKTGVVLLFAASIFLVYLLLFGPLMLHFGPGLTYIFALLLATNVAASVVGILLGGGLFRNKSALAKV
jgi:hypothetical protein